MSSNNSILQNSSVTDEKGKGSYGEHYMQFQSINCASCGAMKVVNTKIFFILCKNGEMSARLIEAFRFPDPTSKNASFYIF